MGVQVRRADCDALNAAHKKGITHRDLKRLDRAPALSPNRQLAVS